VNPEVDRLIRDYRIRLDEESGTVLWDSTSPQVNAQIKAMKREIVARLQELGDLADAANLAHVRRKALERIVTFEPPSMAERTLQDRRKPAEDRMAEAARIVWEWRYVGRKPEVRFNPCRIIDAERGLPLAVPSCLLPEVLWNLKKPETASQRPGSGLRWVESGGSAA
jgi:hypothetical protein